MESIAIRKLYTLSEEYNPIYTDSLGRCRFWNSKNTDIQSPVVSDHLYKSGFRPVWPNGKKFAVCITHDIDFLFSKNSLKHSIANIICKPTPSSFEKLLHRRFKDERYRIERLIDYFLEKEIRTSFYFLSLKDTDTDFNYYLDEIQDSLKKLIDNGFEIGLHGGLNTAFQNEALMKQEKNLLEKTIRKEVSGYRSQWLRFSLPETIHHLEKNDFIYDTTLAYPDMPGFRNGMCYPFNILIKDQTEFRSLVELPLNFMDVTGSSYLSIGMVDYQKMAIDMIDKVEACNGVFTILWHNNNFQGEIFQLMDQIIDYLVKKDVWFGTSSEIVSWWKNSNLQNQNEILRNSLKI